MATNWQIEQGCPQCGAPVTLDETDRILACPFCRTRLYCITAGHFHYYIPPAAGATAELFYVPYWRLRGSCFSVSASGVASRFVDTSARAADLPNLPFSLGLRPQVLKLRFVSPTTEGRFLSAARQAISGLNERPGGVFHERFIGETVSLIHAPFLLKGGQLWDAVLGRPVGPCPSEAEERLRALPAAVIAPVRFVPTLCPHCGWDMEGNRDTLVMLCRNCNSAWACPERDFSQVAFAVLNPPPETAEPVCYLPFWRMKPRFAGLELATWADLIRLANLPKAITPAFAAEPLYFWSPAFKVNPALYARWTRQMTIFRPLGNETDLLPGTTLHPVTLQLAEASEGIVVNLAQLITDKRSLYPRLDSLSVTLEESRLEYHPFLASHNELIHARLQVAIDRTALAFGTAL